MSRAVLTLVLVVASAVVAVGQPVASKSTTDGAIFSGTITAAAPDRITVVRKVPAKPDDSREFAIDGATKVEGRLRVNARVSVRYRMGDDGAAHALHIIVRTDARMTSGRAAPKPPASKK
jgi:hypothetical protein